MTETVSGAALQDLGRRLLTGFYGGLRALKLYPVENAAVQQSLNELHELMSTLLKVEGSVEFAKFIPSQILDSPVTIEASLQDRKVKFDGRIVFVKPIVNTIGEYQIKAEVENRKENGGWLLFPGMYVDMTIHPKK